MPRSLAMILAATTMTACTAPVAVGALVSGGGGLIATSSIYKSDCDGEGCAYGNALAAILGVVSLSLITVGGVSLAIDK